MPFDIQPLHIGIFVALIIVGASWYAMRKNRAADKQAEDLASVIKTGQERRAGAQKLPDALEQDEPDVPMLDDDDQREVEPVEIPDPEPAPVPAAPEPVRSAAPAPVREVGRSSPDIDAAVQAVVYFTPIHSVFDAAKIRDALALYESKKTEGLMQIDFFDQISGLWYHDPSNVSSCTQIYLSMLLAHRGYMVDEYASSSFITLANQMSVRLDAESTPPDSFTMEETAKRVASIIEAYDRQLTLKIVSARDIDPELLAQAAAGCGFEAHEGVFEKTAAGSKEPVMLLKPSAQLKNEVELTLDVPLIAAANDPLAAYFSVANDLCCRIDGVTTDEQGNPIGSAMAVCIAGQLGGIHQSMAAHGVPAGSKRALHIFSRA